MLERNFEERDQEHVAELIANYERMIAENDSCFFEEGSLDQIIEYYEERQNMDMAMKVVNMAVEQHPFSASFLIKKGQLLFDGKDFDNALEALDQAAALDASDLQIYLLRCDIYVWQGKFLQAIDTIEVAMDFAEKDEMPDLYLELADIYEEWERYDDLFGTLMKTLDLDPTNEEALNRMWFCVEFTEKYSESVEYHKMFIDENPYSYLAWFNLAHAYAGLKEYDKAIEAFEFVIAINDEYEYAFKDCGELLFKIKNYQKAADYFLQASLISKPYKELYYSIGECYEHMHNYNRARYYYRKATNLDPYFGDAYYKIGTMYEEENRWGNALTAYERAYKLDEENAEYALSIADVNMHMGDIDKAIVFYRQGVELEPENKDAWTSLARCYVDAGDFREALNLMDKAIIQFEETADLYYIKSAFYYQIGNRHEAFINLERALLQDFESHDLLYDITPYMREDDAVNHIIDQYRK